MQKRGLSIMETYGEREKAKETWRNRFNDRIKGRFANRFEERFQQYVAECEEEEDNEDSEVDSAFESLVLDIEPSLDTRDTTDKDQSTAYLTTFGELTPSEAAVTTHWLTERTGYSAIRSRLCLIYRHCRYQHSNRQGTIPYRRS
jgi:hypothetical protein